MISPTVVILFAILLGIWLLFLRFVWRKYTLRGLAFLCLGIFGMAIMGFTGQLATTPSSAPRAVVSGRCEGLRNIVHRNYTLYLFRIVLHDGKQIQFETQIAPPLSGGVHTIPDGELLQVTYLDKLSPGHLRRAISLKILSGQNKGWHRAVDANWLGAWLMFPAGAIVCAYAAFQMMRNRRSIAPALVQSEDQPEMINLGL